jgi:hypothetical protein
MTDGEQLLTAAGCTVNGDGISDDDTVIAALEDYLRETASATLGTEVSSACQLCRLRYWLDTNGVLVVFYDGEFTSDRWPGRDRPPSFAEWFCTTHGFDIYCDGK